MKKTAAALLTGLFLFFTGCSAGEFSSSEIVPPPSLSSTSSSASGEAKQFPFPDVKEDFEKARQENSDTVGWLYVPGTTINEAVVQAKDNQYYLRRNAKKGYSYAGSLFLDYRADLKNLKQNNVIYGHNLGMPWGLRDDPDGDKFAQLLKFEEIDFARKTPYLYLETGDKQYVFEIFAVFYAEAYTKPVEYHHEAYSAKDFTALVEDMKARSLYNYDVLPDEQDKLLTLSTCSYKYGSYSQNPDQRFVVSARLVREGEEPHEEAQLEKNQAVKLPAYAV